MFNMVFLTICPLQPRYMLVQLQQEQGGGRAWRVELEQKFFRWKHGKHHGMKLEAPESSAWLS